MLRTARVSVEPVRPPMIPGRREPGDLTRFAAGRLPLETTIDVTVDAALRLDREREGGGAVSGPRRAMWFRWLPLLQRLAAGWRGGQTATLIPPAPTPATVASSR